MLTRNRENGALGERRNDNRAPTPRRAPERRGECESVDVGGPRQAWIVVAALVGLLSLASPALGASPQLTFAEYRAQARKVCTAATKILNAAQPASSAFTTTTTVPPLTGHPGSAAAAIASAGSYLQANAHSLAGALKDLQKNTRPSVMDPKLVRTLKPVVEVLTQEYAALKGLQPPSRLASTNDEALADMKSDVASYSTLLAKARANKLTFSGFIAPLLSMSFGRGAEEASLWKKLGVAACNPNA